MRRVEVGEVSLREVGRGKMDKLSEAERVSETGSGMGEKERVTNRGEIE